MKQQAEVTNRIGGNGHRQLNSGNHAAPGHRVDMSSRLPLLYADKVKYPPAHPPMPWAMVATYATPHSDTILGVLDSDGERLCVAKKFRNLQKMLRPYEYCTFRNDSVSRTLDLANYVVGLAKSKLFLKNLVQKYMVGHPNLPRGYKNHTSGFWVRQ